MEVAHPNQLGEVYDRILARSFPPEEVVDRASFVNYATWGEVLVDGDPALAVAVGDYSADTDLLVLEYLAVAPEHRGAGVGAKLFKSALKSWRQIMGPGAFLAEIERPDGHTASEAYGDPARRLKFYRKLGLKALAVPYYQPSLAPGLPAVPDLLLAVLVEDESWVEGDRFLEGARVAALLAERNPEPTPAELPAWEALLAACAGPIELCDLADYARVPRSGPIG